MSELNFIWKVMYSDYFNGYPFRELLVQNHDSDNPDHMFFEWSQFLKRHLI